MDAGDDRFRLYLQPGWSVLVNNAGAESGESTVVLILRCIVDGRTIWVQKGQRGFSGMALSEPAPLHVDTLFVVPTADEMLVEVHKIVHQNGAALPFAQTRGWCVGVPAGWHVKNNLVPDEQLDESTVIERFDELMVYQHLLYEVEVDIGATPSQSVAVGIAEAPAWEEREITIAPTLAAAIPIAERFMRRPFDQEPPLRAAPPPKKRGSARGGR